MSKLWYFCFAFLLFASCDDDVKKTPDSGPKLAAASAVPHQVILPESVAQIAAGNTHICVIVSSGNVFCWGGSLSSAPIPYQEAIRVALGKRKAEVISSGQNRTCAGLSDGALSCWGTKGGPPIDLIQFSTTPTTIYASGAGNPCLSVAGQFGCYLYPNSLTLFTDMPTTTTAYAYSTHI